jgi:hypothetical protein
VLVAAEAPREFRRIDDEGFGIRHEWLLNETRILRVLRVTAKDIVARYSGSFRAVCST